MDASGFAPGGVLLVASFMAAHTGASVSFSIPLPGDLSLCGFTASIQAALTGPGLVELSNALDMVTGQ